jgi:hypothetical protein
MGDTLTQLAQQLRVDAPPPKEPLLLYPLQTASPPPLPSSAQLPVRCLPPIQIIATSSATQPASLPDSSGGCGSGVQVKLVHQSHGIPSLTGPPRHPAAPPTSQSGALTPRIKERLYLRPPPQNPAAPLQVPCLPLPLCPSAHPGSRCACIQPPHTHHTTHTSTSNLRRGPT